MFDTNLFRQKMTEKTRDLSKAIKAGTRDEFDKAASKFSETLAIGNHFYGASRQIYGALNGGKYHKLTSADTDKIKIENDNERIRVELPVQPDIEQFIGDTRPRKLFGGPYLETDSGRYVKGYFTRLVSPAKYKHQDLLEAYPYDFVAEMEKANKMSILKQEDFYMFYGTYGLIADVEVDMVGKSIMAVTEAYWGSYPHHAVIDLVKMHGSSVKLNQPRELVVMSEDLYMDFGKVPESEITNLSASFMDKGFSPDASPFWNFRKMFLKDSRGLTYAPHNANETLFTVEDDTKSSLQKEITLLKLFGYSVQTASVDPATRAALAAVLLDRYGIVYDTEVGSPDATYETRSKFTRVLVFSPLNYVGRIYLWNYDTRSHITVENEVVSGYCDERITYLLHNKYAVTALDVWS